MSDRIHLNTTHANSYFIQVGYNLIDDVRTFISGQWSCQKGVIIVDEKVLHLYGDTFIQKIVDVFEKAVCCSVPEGESSKSIEAYSNILGQILNSGVERNTPVIVIGGGVTGDLGGFVAASSLRGMPLIHIPTTLLSMVDSSIGGKTGINHSAGKNLIGAFYEPTAVFTDLKFLETLPRKEISNGLGEVIKYGMISNAAIFKLLKQLPVNEAFTYSENWKKVVEICVGIKVSIVEEDFKESGIREFLNFGHTFAHVIEKVGNFEEHSHGEAVYMGMWGGVKVSNLLGFNVNATNLSAFRPLYDLTFRPDQPVKELTSLMMHDKKVNEGEIKVIGLEALEKPFSKIIKDHSVIHSAWEFIMQEFS